MDEVTSLVDVSKENIGSLSKKKKVGNYLLGKVIGQGSFSKVRQGIHIIAREKLAVKIVPKKALLLREYVKKAVRREAVLLQKLDHPNIVRLYEIMETENSYYLVLEMAESGDFIKYLSQKKYLKEFECQKYIRQMTSALDHMHTSNITHRDLKLENLLLDKDYNLKIIDFGLSNIFYGDASLSTQCGSPVYAAPEIFCNKKYGSAVDVWSMGVCMYAMLTGVLPFIPDPPSNLTLLHALILKGAHIPDTLSEGCRHLLSKMLTIDVSQRIRIDDILRHRWVLENHDTPLITRQPPVGKLYPHIPKAPVINYMTNVFTFIEEDIFHSVIERKLNAVAATYHLLEKRFNAGFLLTNGYSVNKNSFAFDKISNSRNTNDVGMERGVGLPQLSKEHTFISETGTKGTSNPYKHYIQLLKDSKNRSAHMPRSHSFTQKELTLRRYKTRTDVLKNNRIPEDSAGYLPDFILTYTENGEENIPKKTVGGYEWEQSFIGDSLNRKHKLYNVENIKYGRLRHEKDENNSLIGDYGRGALLIGEALHLNDDPMSEINELKAPPTTPATFFIDRVAAVNRQNTKMLDKTLGDLENESEGGTDTKSGIEDARSDTSWSAFHRQKSRLARGVTLLDKKSGNSNNVNYGIPITHPKTLTPREAKMMDDIEQAGVTGRKILERSRTMAGNFEDFHSIWTRKSKTASTQKSQDQTSNTVNRDMNDFRIGKRSADSNSILHLPKIVSEPPPTIGNEQTVLDLRPQSPPKQTVVDGVTDVIRIQITGSAKH